MGAGCRNGSRAQPERRPRTSFIGVASANVRYPLPWWPTSHIEREDRESRGDFYLRLMI